MLKKGFEVLGFRICSRFRGSGYCGLGLMVVT